MSDKLSVKATKAALIKDIKELNEKNPGNVTRNYYRANGKFTEAQWQKLFPKFSDFLAAAGIKADNLNPETSEISGDTWTITIPKTRIHTLEQLLDYCKVDLSVWQVDKFIVNKWEIGAKNEGEDLVVEPLFQVKAFLKRRNEIISIKKEIEDLKLQAKKEARHPDPIERPVHRSGNMLEINIPDVHFGKLSWGEETGYENYDTKIAEKMFMRALNTLLDKVKTYKFEQVVFVVGNDLFNSDDIE